MSPLRLAGLWGPVVLFMALVWGLAGDDELRSAVHLWDKAAHSLAWLVFGTFCLRATHGGVRPLRRGPAVAGTLLAVGYGGLDEWHQLSVPGREASRGDVVADAVGAIAALFVMWALARFLRKQRTAEALEDER